MENLELVIFDLDGTLFNPEELIVKAVYEAIEATSSRFGLDLKYPNRDKIYRSVGELDYEFFRELEPGIAPEQAKYLRSLFAEIEGDMVKRGLGTLYPGALDALKILKDSGYRTAIASNLGRDYLLAIMDQYNLEQHIDFSVSIDDIGHTEKREMLEEILQNQEVLPSEVILVADRESDFKAARDLAITSIACTWGFGAREELQAADYVINSFEELIRLVEQGKSI